MSDPTVGVEDLSPKQRELLLLRLRRANSEQVKPAAIERVSSVGAPLPLSYAQQRQWFLEQMEPGIGAYNIPKAVRLRGVLDHGALERAVTEVVRRHEVLRTVYVMNGDRPAQIIQPPFEVKVSVTDISHLGEEEREKDAFRLTTEEARRPFDLAKGPVLRVGLIRLGADDHIVSLTVHHIASDGWSLSVLVKELVTLYDAFTNGRPSPFPDLTIQYADYAAWQQSWLRGEALERQLDYWKRQLDGAPALELPTDRPRPPVQSFRGVRANIRLSSELSSAIQALARREGASLFMVLLSAWQVLLSRYSDQEDISVGSFIANRNHAETEPLIGFFINNLVFRTDLSGNPTFRELLGRTRRVALEAYMRQDTPFEMVLEALRPERDASRTSLFQVMFVMQNMPQAEVQAAQTKFSPVEASDPGRANFDLTLWMWEGPVGLAGWLDYSTDLFESSTIERLIGHFVLLLESVVADPDGRLRQLPLLSDAERRQLLAEWNANKQDYPAGRFVQQLFEAQAARQPEAEAVIFEGTRLTYGELNARANQLAHYLRANGVGPETRVGICVERSVEMVLGALGVLKAGGAYVPLDPSYPRERLLFMMEDSQASWLLTQHRLVQSLPAATAQSLGARANHVRVLRLDADMEALAGASAQNPICNVAPENLAYVIYTSGSTQRPRGVMVRHNSLVNAFYAWEKAYSLSARIKTQLQVASFAFDVFSGDLTRVLCTGARLVIAPGEFLLSAPELYELMRREAVEGVEIVPAVLRNLAGYLEETGQSLDFMRLIVAGADAFYVKEMERIRRLCGPNTRLINSYGLTEATIDSSYFEKTEIELPPEKMAPIGRPFANTEIYILDRSLQPVPVGVAGELHVGGPALARGYLNQPALTAAKFIPHPFSHQPGARLYKTGDLARYLPDGNVEFLRRMDYQVKVRGFRIEPEEIESVLTSHEGVREALVTPHESALGEKRLVAYIVPSQSAPPSVQELQQQVREHLPAYMLPAAFIMLDAFPLSPNGKVDRKALPAPDPETLGATDTYVEPSTPLEEMIVDVWEEVLGRKRIGVFDNFFEVGGHSLLATQIIARLRKNLDMEIPLGSIFMAPTIAEMAVMIEEMMLREIGDTGDDGSPSSDIQELRR
ncbi:MAG TPA: amino acid adenylation domain-containing protein [Blastocatellia bacterium]|nr:amino acid adenylation domain-containing protein [Blastocatellia bacterium]